MTAKELESLEKEIKETLKGISSFTGIYYSLPTIPVDVYQILMREDIMFDNSDKFFQSGKVLCYRFGYCRHSGILLQSNFKKMKQGYFFFKFF